jgi:hypothetical protein
MKYLCRNCNFLAKEYHEPNTGRNLSFSLSQSDREKAVSGQFGFIEEVFSLNCRMGVWDEGAGADKDHRLQRVNITDRKDKCFFFPYDPGMLFDAAKELQRRDQENRQLKRTNWHTLIGLWIAALALLLNAALGIIRLLK